MVELAALAVVVILVLNLVVATVMTWRRHPRDGWLPVILLGGTSMIAVVAVGTMLLPETALNRDRGIDVALVVAFMAAVAAVVPAVLVRAAAKQDAAGRTPGSDSDPEPAQDPEAAS
ncbi:hypothetical protein [uncultured Corynebacterium sp.]|uniref:hypothetical protein n=1 Tax=uncultured Corynebacterium sp. TaxID=159447 RepID=UPI0025D370DD|nr:hypothetical protein [uncultured Corynebacterium sp.]